MTTDIGTFTEGEIPPPLEYQFLDEAGDPINLTGYTATFHTRIGGVDTDLTASVSDPAEGVVTHVWVADELARQNGRGALRCEFAATNGTNTYISERLHGYIREPIREPAP